MGRGGNCDSAINLFSNSLMPRSSKRGQVTIFVIIAIIIVVAGILIYQFGPGIRSTSSSVEQNPKEYIRSCIEDDLVINLQTILAQGGNYEPQHPYLYNGEQIDYLCYTPNNGELCQVEKPMLISHVERQLVGSLEAKYTECFEDLTSDYEEQGYVVDVEDSVLRIAFYPNEVRVMSFSVLTTNKKEIKTFDDFNLKFPSGAYDILSIAYNILNWEAAYGDADVNVYMDLDDRYIIDKIKRTDGTKIYVIKERKTGEIFQFASRSNVISAGYPGIQNE